MAVQIAELLKLPALRQARTVAGERGLDREVEYIDVLESPDSGAIKPRGLYLTSGFLFQAIPQFQGMLVTQMQEKGAAGILLQLGSYLKEVPQEMLAAANRLEFPVIALPEGSSFAAIIKEGLEHVFFQQEKEIRRSQETQKKLAELAYTGADLQQIAQTIVSLVANTIIVADRDFSLLSYAYLDKPYKGRKPRVYAGKIIDKYLYNLKRTGFIDKIRSRKKAERAEVLFSNLGQQAWVIVPVLINGEILGYIAMLEDQHRLCEQDWQVLVQAANVTAVAIYKQLAEGEVVRRRRNDFLAGVLEGSVQAGQAALEQAAALQVDLNKTWLAVQLEFRSPIKFTQHPLANEEQDDIAAKQWGIAMLTNQLTTRQSDLLVVGQQSGITILCPLNAEAAGETIAKRVEMIRHELHVFSPELEIVLGVSRPCRDYRLLPEAYGEAKEALEIGRKLNRTGSVHYFDDLGVYQFLTKVRDMPELQSYYQSVIGKLDGVEPSVRHDLVKTLEQYFSANGNVFKAAQGLYLHRNSMKYRLERIQELLGVDLDDAEVRFNLQLALKIRPLMQR
ncbi:PucR family transcriptional regulator [Anaerospora hongkongensis]|uniref:PucR family transcriptional regulator n=1 Tax=Anaerospora hongkongensis TaxID=244830 RepID=UPI0028A06D28|nr:PucR family transcriptional regulator ligand-binding domain-containing protein [Anaerospora hongkongensis]